MTDLYLPDATATERFGASLVSLLPEPCLVYLHGDLGAGKTTLVRGYLRALGYAGTVKSPTYTLVEEYRVGARIICHFDLYRLRDPEELEWLGIGDYLDRSTVSFIEWPERGAGWLPAPDVSIALNAAGVGRSLCYTGIG